MEMNFASMVGFSVVVLGFVGVAAFERFWGRRRGPQKLHSSGSAAE